MAPAPTRPRPIVAAGTASDEPVRARPLVDVVATVMVSASTPPPSPQLTDTETLPDTLVGTVALEAEAAGRGRLTRADRGSVDRCRDRFTRSCAGARDRDGVATGHARGRQGRAAPAVVRASRTGERNETRQCQDCRPRALAESLSGIPHFSPLPASGPAKYYRPRAASPHLSTQADRFAGKDDHFFTFVTCSRRGHGLRVLQLAGP